MIDIYVDPEKCTGCGECIRVCPKGPRIYRIVEKKWQEGGRSPGKEFLHRLHHMLNCLQSSSDKACTELVNMDSTIRLLRNKLQHLYF